MHVFLRKRRRISCKLVALWWVLPLSLSVCYGKICQSLKLSIYVILLKFEWVIWYKNKVPIWSWNLWSCKLRDRFVKVELHFVPTGFFSIKISLVGTNSKLRLKTTISHIHVQPGRFKSHVEPRPTHVADLLQSPCGFGYVDNTRRELGCLKTIAL